MTFIIAYKLKRKNARRKILLRLFIKSEESAIKRFDEICFVNGDSDKRQYELLTGDWKHIAFYEEEK